MSFEWDPNKAKSNLQKHGVRFSDSVSIFEDENALTILDEDETEERYVTIGLDVLGQLLVVVFTWRKENIRIISARKATNNERKVYENYEQGI
jgi:uncharacterized protein